MDLSFQEKSVWVSLIAIVVVFGYHFSEVFGTTEVITSGDFVVRLIGVIIMLVVIEIALHILIAVSEIQDAADGGAMDERDRLIATRASRNAYFVLFIGVLIMIGTIVAGDLKNDPGITPVMSANLLLLAIVVAELVNFGSRLFYYRSGI